MQRKNFEKFVNGNCSIFGNKCAKCGRPMTYREDPQDWEFMKTKSSYIFICVKCLKGESHDPNKS